MSLGYRSEIDGLRAVAVLPVILFHAGFGVFSGGYVGVDVFFVISGYLITSIIVAEIAEGRFSLVRFYERRARRILPALFTVVAASAITAWVLFTPSEMEEFSQSVFAVMAFASNIFFWLKIDYFGTAAEMKPLLHTWSLAVEEQFYIFFPLLMMVTWRLGLRTVVWILIGIFAASLVLAEFGSTRFSAANFYLLPARAWELLVGSLAALYLRAAPIPLSLAIKNIFSALGLGAILLAVFTFGSETPFPSLYALIPTLGTVLIILFADPGTAVHRILSLRVFVAIGLVSYGLYLWHQPVLAFHRAVDVEEASVSTRLFLVLLSIALAGLTYFLVERPLRFRWRLSGRTLAFASAVPAAVFAAFGLLGSMTAGYTDIRFPDAPAKQSFYPAKDQAAARLARRGKPDSCAFLDQPILDEEVCLATSEEPELLVIGDSKAMALFSAVPAGRIERPAMLIGGHSCPMYPGLSYSPDWKRAWGNNCTAIAEKALQVATEVESLTTVIIANVRVAVNDQPSRYRLDGRPLSNREAFRTGYTALASKLRAAGLDVRFLSDVPRLIRSPEHCVYFADRFADECLRDRAEVTALQAEYAQEVARLGATLDMPVTDAFDFICATGECAAFRDGKLLYFDRTHITPFAGQALIQALLSATPPSDG